MIYDITL